jgi:hypothetical protein
MSFNGVNTTNFGGNITNSNFNATIFSRNVQMFFRRTSTVEAITNSDYFGEIASYGDTVRILKEPTITVSDYLRGDTVTSQAIADDELTLVLDQAKKYQFQIDDIEKSIAHVDWETLATGSATYALKQSYDQAVLDYMSINVDKSGILNTGASAEASNAAAIIVAEGEPVVIDFSTGDLLLDGIADMALNLNIKDVPQENRWLVLPFEAQRVLTDVASKMMNADFNSGENFKNGLIARNLHGFDVYVTNNCPTYTSTGVGATAVGRFIVMSGQKSSTAAANALVKTEKFRHPDTFADVVRGLHVYGRQVLRDTAMTASYCKFA